MPNNIPWAEPDLDGAELDQVVDAFNVDWLTMGPKVKAFERVMTECVDGVVQALVDIGAELGKTPAQVAFAWILDHPEITAAISGPDLPEHIEEVCGAVGWQLDEEARSKLDEVSRFTPLKSYV